MKRFFLIIILCAFTLQGKQADYRQLFIKRQDVFGNELYQMNEWVSYNATKNMLSINKKGYFKLSRTMRDSLELDAAYKYKQLSIY